MIPQLMAEILHVAQLREHASHYIYNRIGTPLTLFTVFVTVWALWTRELATLGILAGFAYLAKVVRENKANDIDP